MNFIELEKCYNALNTSTNPSQVKELKATFFSLINYMLANEMERKSEFGYNFENELSDRFQNRLPYLTEVLSLGLSFGLLTKSEGGLYDIEPKNKLPLINVLKNVLDKTYRQKQGSMKKKVSREIQKNQNASTGEKILFECRAELYRSN
ncbi:MAG: hypothetical protein ACXAC7_13700 [Candidatus Hodarchaeales archaeon]|jgi:hypothetical protein